MRIRMLNKEDGYVAVKSSIIACKELPYTVSYYAIINTIFKGCDPWISIEYSHNGAKFSQHDYGTVSITRDIDIFLGNEMSDLCTHWSLYPEKEKRFINEFKELVNEVIKKEVLTNEKEV